MVNPENQNTPRPRGNKWLALVILILPVLIFISFVVGEVISQNRKEARRVQEEIQKRLDAIRAAGQPVTAQDLAKRYPDPPPEHDAALLLKPALAELSLPDDLSDLPFFGRYLPRSAPLGETTQVKMRGLLGANAPSFALVPWDELKGAWVGSGYSDGLSNVTAGPIKGLDRLPRLLCWNAMLQAEDKHTREAVASLQHALILGSTLKFDMEIHYLIRASVQMWVCKTLEHILNHTTLSDTDLRLLRTDLEMTNVGATKEFMTDELCYGLFRAEALRNKSTLPAFFGNDAAAANNTQFLDQDLLAYLRWYEHISSTLDLPVSNAIADLKSIESEREKARKKEKNSFLRFLVKPHTSLLAEDEPNVCRYFVSEVKTVALVRACRCALAIERWRYAHGDQAPDSLAMLVPDYFPAIPRDPFDDQPLRYKKLAQGYVVYSIGPDFIDDGGKEEPADAKESDHYDITFTIERSDPPR